MGAAYGGGGTEMKTKIILVVIVIFQILLLIGLKFTAWPEMILWPYLNLHGWRLYSDIAIAHAPLLLWKLSVFYWVFGVGITQLKIFTWLLVFVFDVLVYIVSRKLFNEKLALVTLTFFVFWQIFFEGNGLWFDLFMAIPAFISFYFVRRKTWLFAEIFLGLAFISKQTAIWFLVPVLIEIFQQRQWMGLVKKFIVGLLLVLLLFIAALYLLRILPDFYNWAIKFGIFELPRAQGQIQFPDLKNFAIAVFPFLIFIPLFLGKRKESLMLFLWALAGAAGTYPRFEYFHFQPAIPYLAIASALVFTSRWEKDDLIKAFVPVYVLGGLYLFGGFFMRNWGEGTRFYEKEVKDVASYVKSNSNVGDKIFVLNYWDNIYALTGTLPAVDPWIPQLSWYMNRSGVQEKMISDLKSSKPALILLNPYAETGLGSYQPHLVYNFVKSNYVIKETMGRIEVLVPKK